MDQITIILRIVKWYCEYEIWYNGIYNMSMFDLS